MLSQHYFKIIKSSFEYNIGQLSVPATWERAKNQAFSGVIPVSFKTAGVKDEAIINAYGINAVIMVVRAIDTAIPPEKFDSFVIEGVRHTADAVHPIHLNGSIVGWKIYVRGAN